MSFNFSPQNENIDKIVASISSSLIMLATVERCYLSLKCRHISLIEKALESLEAVNQGLELGMPVDLLQVDMTHYLLGSFRRNYW